MVPPASKTRPPLLSLTLSPWAPPPPNGWAHPTGGVEFNKGSFSHMLKRYANVQVLLFFWFPHHLPPPNWLLFSPSQSQTQREGERVCEREFGCLFFRGMDYFVRTALGYLIWKAITMIAIRINYIMSYRNCERGTWRASLWGEESWTHTHPIIPRERQDGINSATKLVTSRPTLINKIIKIKTALHICAVKTKTILTSPAVCSSSSSSQISVIPI